MYCGLWIAVAEISKIRVARISIIYGYRESAKELFRNSVFVLGELKSPGKQYPRRTGTTGEIFSSIGNKSPVKRAKINTFYGGYPLIVDCYALGVRVDQYWPPGHAHADVAGSVQGVPSELG